MAEPFSVASAAVGLADVAIRFGKYVQKLRKQAKDIEEELETLQNRVKLCENICEAIQRGFADTENNPPDEKLRLGDLTATLDDAARLISNMEHIVEGICNPPSLWAKTHFNDWVKAHKLLQRDKELQHCYDKLATWLYGMNLILERLDLRSIKQAQEQTLNSLTNIQSEVGTLQTQVSDLHGLLTSSGYRKTNDDSPNALERLLKSTTPKTYFYIPEAVQSFFTGRSEQLEELSTTFILPPGPLADQVQPRFVIHGVAGSGKTQFCCKFADMNRDRFWGIFWVNGASEVDIMKSFEKIARIGKRPPTKEAAMDWLSSVEERWLLLIDNADDNSINLGEYFPQARGGHILITTRSEEFKVHGTTGKGYYSFSGLQRDEASDLLLRVSHIPRPWGPYFASKASKITDTLGFLVLAIVHAGAAIRNKLCDLNSYIPYFDQKWEAIRDHPTAHACTKDERAVFVSFEVCFERLGSNDPIVAADAKDLLHLFAFMSREGLSVQILLRAMSNAEYESKDEQDRLEEDRKQRIFEKLVISKKLRSLTSSAFTWMLGQDKEPPLPNLIRDGRRKGDYIKSEHRVRQALHALTKFSLLSSNDEDETYTMHPLVHKWARERIWDHKRPGVALANQALFAELAGQVLAASILLPHLVTELEVTEYHRTLLPHVEKVQEHRELITRNLDKAQLPFWTKVLGTRKSMHADRIKMFAKFCVVYSQCGEGDKAKVLLQEVVRFLDQNLGIGEATTRLATTALAGVYWELGQPDKALELQRSVVDACERYLGLEHPDTFRAWDTLGLTLFQQGRFDQAEDLQRKAVAGLRALRENTDSHTVNAAMLEAVNNLGQNVAKFSAPKNMTEASELYTEAIAGMKEIQHPRLSHAMENLAWLLARLGEELPKALELINGVIELRKRQNGKQAPMTLLAHAGKAIVLSANNQLREAEELIIWTSDTASRILLPDHIGIFLGKYILATIINHQGRHVEAEEMLIEVSERQKKLSHTEGSIHPDRIASLIELARCYQLQGKYDRSIAICDEIIEGFDKIYQGYHPYRDMLKAARASMVKIKEREDTMDIYEGTIVFPDHLFKSSIL